jgi:hypothetical protein
MPGNGIGAAGRVLTRFAMPPAALKEPGIRGTFSEGGTPMALALLLSALLIVILYIALDTIRPKVLAKRRK